MIAVCGDPLEDPTVLSKVSFVMKRGEIYKQNGAACPSCHSFQKPL